MSKSDRTGEAGITTVHARSCRHRESRCTCTPKHRAEAWDATAGKRVYKTFPTISAARRWRQDAYKRAARRHAERGARPDVAEGR